MTATATRTVQNLVTAPGGTKPWAGKQVSIRLNTGGFADGGQREIIREVYATTDATGLWSIPLELTSGIDPAGTYYTVREAAGVIWAFQVPDGSGSLWLHDILVDPVPNTDPLTGVSSVDGKTGVVTLSGTYAPLDPFDDLLAKVARAYIDAADHGWAPGASATTNDTAIADATTAALEAGLPLWLGAGTYHTSVPIDWSSGLVVAWGAGEATVVVQDTASAACALLGNAGNDVSGMTFEHGSDFSVVTGNGIETYDLYLSKISRVKVNNCASSVKQISGFFFSNLIENLFITGFTTNALYLNNPGNTGSVWNNIYINNTWGGIKRTCSDYAINLTGMNDGVINQLNVEHGLCAGAGMLLQDCTNLTINGLHYEDVSLLGFGATYVNVYGKSKITINGMALVFSDVGAPGSTTSGGREVINVGGGAAITVNNFHAEGNTNTLNIAGLTLASVQDAGSEAWINGGIAADIFTSAPSGNVHVHSQARVTTLAVSSNTYTPNEDTTDVALITSPSANFTVANPSGTAIDEQKLLIKVKSSATGRAPSWGTAYASSGVATLPSTTLPASKTVTFGFVYDATATKWVLLALDATGY